MTIPIRVFIGNAQDFNRIVLQGTKGHPATPYAGSGTPWNSETDTPFCVAGNPNTGEYFVLKTPNKTTITEGSPAFTAWQFPNALHFSNQSIDIPLQLYATDEYNMADLVTVIRRKLYEILHNASGLFLTVQYMAGSLVASDTRYRIVSANFQELASFWANEANNQTKMMRGILSLTVTIGSAGILSLPAINNIANGANNTTLLADIRGDLAYHGQPMELDLTGSIINSTPKELFLCVNDDFDSVNVNTTLTATPATPAISTNAPDLPAFGRVQALAVLSNISANARIRLRMHWKNSGSTATGSLLYASPWITPGAVSDPRLFNFGYFIPSSVSELNVGAVIEVQSTNASNANATVGYVYMMRVRTFCCVRITSDVQLDRLIVVSPSPGLDTNYETLISRPHQGGAFKLRLFPAPYIGSSEQVEGSIPVAIHGAGFWHGMNDSGVFDPSGSINVGSMSSYIRLRETIGLY